MKLLYLILIYIFLLFGNVEASSTIPISNNIDLKPYCPSPGNQQGENTCVGFVFAHAMTVLQAIKHQNISTTSIDTTRFSPYFLYNQIKSVDQKGAKYSTAIEFLKQQGNCMIKEFKNGKDNQIVPDSSVIKKALHYRIKSGGTIFDNRNTTEQKIDLLKTTLRDSIPVILNFRAYRSFVQLPKRSLYWSNTPEQEDTYQDHHGLLVIGYDGTYFEVMNSWGTAWGNNGFVKIPQEVLAQNSLRGYAISFKPIDSTNLQFLPTDSLEKNSKLGVYTPPSIFQKPSKVFLDKSLSEEGNALLNKAIATSDGSILAIGSYRNKLKQQQLLFSKIKQDGTTLFTYKGRLNDLDNEVGVSVVELADSLFLLGGYMTPTEKNTDFLQSSIWLNFHQSSGQKTKRRILKKSPFPLKLEAMEKSGNQLAFVGIEQENLWLLLTDMEGHVLSEKANFRKSSSDLPFHSAQILVTNHFIYIYGSIQLLAGKKKGVIPRSQIKKVPYLFKLNKKGELLKEMKFSDITLEKTGRIRQDKEGQLMMTGTLSKDEKGKYFFLRIPQTLDKELMVLEKFGKIEKNQVADLIALEGGEILLLGNSKRQGSRTFDVFLNKINRYGALQWETPWYHGSKYDEKGIQLLQKEDYSLWICGLKDNGNGFNSNFWFLCINEAGTVKQTVEELNKLNITSKQEQTQFSINRAAQTSLKYKLKNKHANRGVKVKVKITCADCPTNFDLSEQQKIINISPDEEQLISLTIEADKKTKYGKNNLSISFFNEANQILFEERLTIQVKDIEKEPFEIGKIKFENNNENLEKEITVFVEIKNKSRQTHKNVKLKFEEEEEMTVLGDNYFEETIWKAGEKKIFKLNFMLDKAVPLGRFSLEAFIFFGRNSAFTYPLLITP